MKLRFSLEALSFFISHSGPLSLCLGKEDVMISFNIAIVAGGLLNAALPMRCVHDYIVRPEYTRREDQNKARIGQKHSVL